MPAKRMREKAAHCPRRKGEGGAKEGRESSTPKKENGKAAPPHKERG